MKTFQVRVTHRLRKMIDARLGISLPLGMVKFSLRAPLELEPPCRLSGGVDLTYPTYVGAFSYFDHQERVARILDRGVRIGRYCSFATDVKLGLIPHPTTYLSTSPTIYDPPNTPWSKHFNKPLSGKTEYNPNVHETVVGNDVWLGADVKVMRGLTIGNGAIIGSGAVVTHDVPPYAIMGGVPARLIRYRFDSETIKRLEKIQWWRYDLSSLPPLNFSDTIETLSTLEQNIQEGHILPYDREKVTVKDFMPYARFKLFHIDYQKGWLRVKIFGVWLIHMHLRTI